MSFPVFPSTIVSSSPHSFAPITGTPHAIDSTGDIPKSSSTGIYIIAIALDISEINISSRGAGMGNIFLYPDASVSSLSFSGSFCPYVKTRFCSGFFWNASITISTRFGGESLEVERKYSPDFGNHSGSIGFSIGRNCSVSVGG